MKWNPKPIHELKHPKISVIATSLISSHVNLWHIVLGLEGCGNRTRQSLLVLDVGLGYSWNGWTVHRLVPNLILVDRAASGLDLQWHLRCARHHAPNPLLENNCTLNNPWNLTCSQRGCKQTTVIQGTFRRLLLFANLSSILSADLCPHN